MREKTEIRLFNRRYLPLFAAFLILGIFCVKVSMAVAVILWVVAAFCAFALFFTKMIHRGVAVALVAALFLGYGAASLALYVRNEVGFEGKDATVTCRVIQVTARVTEDEEGEETTLYRVTADKVKIGKSYGGGIAFETEEPLVVGDRVTVVGDVSVKPLSLNSFTQALQYRKGSKYQIDDAAVVFAEEGTAPLAYRVKTAARKVLIQTQGERAGAFTYATLFGDTEFMLEEDKTAMRSVGVAHVFAVSGLHIGVLAGVLLFILRKFKLKDGVSLLILLPIFGFYAYLSGFTPSVLRAVIMVSLGLVASHFGMRYDGISALSFAAILVLLTRPLLLFDLSFVMSFLAIFGLQSLTSPLKRAFAKHMKEKLAEALALSIATTLALVPVSAVVFGRITLVGFLLNVIVVPLASASYVLSLVGLLLTAMIPSFGALLTAISLLPSVIIELSGAVASLGLTINYDFCTAEILVYYATLAFVGKYSLAAKKVKLVAGGVGAGVLVLLILAV